MAGGDVFADTSALYAFVNKRDVLHSEARARRRPSPMLESYTLDRLTSLATAIVID
jgi:predicted nucleic acid-binding protein